MDLDYVRVYQKDVSVIKNPRGQHLPQSLALVNPSSAQLKVYDLGGKMVADYSNKIRQMKVGDNVMKTLPVMLSRGTYIARVSDNGNSYSLPFVSVK